ncbi:MAG: Rnf-Nqr domain containing protein [Oscillospiraceae bacterium]|nr:Rnf-Nqr domain containing protein [Oscillospiraceae bacterium]
MNKLDKGFLFEEVLLKNPVLVGTIGLCPVVAICTSLKAAVIMSIVTVLTLVVAQTLTAILFNKIPQWVRASLYMLVGMIVVVPSMIILGKLSAETMVAMGIYLPLLSVNPLIVRQCERESVDSKLIDSLKSALCAGLAYSIVLLIVGLVREVIGNASIWGVKIPGITPATAFLMPMGGFVIIAYLAALLRVYFRKLDPEFADEISINSRATTKRHRSMKAMLIDVDVEEESVYTMPEAEPIIIPIPSIPSESVEEVSSSEEILPSKEIESDIVAQPEVVEPKPKAPKKNKTQATKNKTQTSKNKKTNKKKSTKAKSQNVEEKVEEKAEETIKPKFEFITLDLPSAADKKEKNVDGATNKESPNKDVSKREPSKKGTSKKDTQKKDALKGASTKNQSPKKSCASKTKSNGVSKSEVVKESPDVVESSKSEKIKEPKTEIKKDSKKDSNKNTKKNSKIVYKSEELERLMSLSLDDIINDLPNHSESKEGGEEK